MKRNFLFLINPIAGTRSKIELESFLRTKAKAHGLSFSIIHTNRGMDAADLLQTAEETKATDLVVCGGDGTVNLAARAIQGTSINLGVIPVGSGNGLARSAAIPLFPSAAFDIILKGNKQRTDGFRVNGHFGCMLSGLGLDAAVAERFAKSTRRGLYTYTTQTLIQFFKASAYQFSIQIPGYTFTSDAFFISIANSNQFGNNITIAPKASLSDGLLDVVVVQKMMKANALLSVVKQVKGNNKLQTIADPVETQNVLYFQTPSLIISNPQLAPLHIDGDPFETAKTITVDIIPAAFNLVVP